MAFDRSAQRAQVARIIAHHASDEVLLKLLGKGEAFPAAITFDRLIALRVTEGMSNRQGCVVEIAADVRGVDTCALMFAGERPREEQHFTDTAGRLIRIIEDRTVPFAASFVYACEVSAP